MRKIETDKFRILNIIDEFYDIIHKKCCNIYINIDNYTNTCITRDLSLPINTKRICLVQSVAIRFCHFLQNSYVGRI